MSPTTTTKARARRPAGPAAAAKSGPAAAAKSEAPNGAAGAPAQVPPASLVVVPLDALVDGRNPRRNLGDLEGLAASIRAAGIVEPLIVEPTGDQPPTYRVIAGHRRKAAARLAGVGEVPCVVRSERGDARQLLELALIENLQREGLDPLDEAEGYKALAGLGLTQTAIAARIGCTQSHVSKRLALLDLPAPVRARITKGTLTLEAAAALTRLKDHPAKLKKAAGEDPSRIAYAVEMAEKDVAFEAKVAELRKAAEAKGWPVVELTERHRADKRPYKTLEDEPGYAGHDLDIDVAKHRSEPCHAVALPKHRTYAEPKAVAVCREPARHGPKGESSLKLTKPAKPKRELDPYEAKRKEDDRNRKECAGWRASAIRDALAGYRWRASHGRTPPALALCLRALVADTLAWDVLQIACELLDLQKGKGWDQTLREYSVYSVRDDDHLHRAALAVSLARVEVWLRSTWHSWADPRVEAHFAFLADAGYELAPWEQAQLDKAKADDDEDDLDGPDEGDDES